MADGVVWHDLLREDLDDEKRVVRGTVADDGVLLLEELSSGFLTQLAFGAPSCVRKLTIAAGDVLSASAALGAENGNVSLALASLFADEDACLSDVLDALDGAGTPYSYAVSCGGEVALRP